MLAGHALTCTAVLAENIPIPAVHHAVHVYVHISQVQSTVNVHAEAGPTDLENLAHVTA